MATTVQFRRGNTADNNNFTGKLGEITVDTDKWQLRIHDNVTVGGHVVSSGGGSGSVTSVGLSGGSTGLQVLTNGNTYSAITSTGTFSLSGTLNTLSGGTGTANPVMTSSDPLSITGTWPNVNVALTGTVSTANGGTGVSTAPAANQVLLGTGQGYALTTLVAGNGVTFDQTQANILTIKSSASGSGNTITLADMPPGSIQWFAMQTPPAGWLECDGRILSRTANNNQYAPLWAAIQYTYGGSGDSFTIPDLRGQFLRGWDHGSGVDAGRAFGSKQAATGIRVLLDNYVEQGAAHNPVLPAIGAKNIDGFEYGAGSDTSTVGGDTTTYSGLTQGGGVGDNYRFKVRPTNVAMLACIKYTTGVGANYVSNVNVISGVNALAFSGGPITNSGTIQLNINGGSSNTYFRGDGIWATPAENGLGYNQTYQDVTSTRANNTNYTNTTGKPIWISVLTSGSASNAQTNRLYCDNVIIADMNNDSNFQALLTGIIPPGSVYKVILGASYGVSRWIELR
jgi:hypothetical protein